ncbi:hypothetical protein RRG08_022526 [Elysia crispata]|uniref:Uncharacterized protein n=1 Tax=Elysia crispata TaxID=231223 RepID=A0AAE0Z1N2_9GAST|nr:hypothetical protein RRG08_022526 [Elysia crispata]
MNGSINFTTRQRPGQLSLQVENNSANPAVLDCIRQWPGRQVKDEPLWSAPSHWLKLSSPIIATLASPCGLRAASVETSPVVRSVANFCGDHSVMVMVVAAEIVTTSMIVLLAGHLYSVSSGSTQILLSVSDLYQSSWRDETPTSPYVDRSVRIYTSRAGEMRPRPHPMSTALLGSIPVELAR